MTDLSVRLADGTDASQVASLLGQLGYAAPPEAIAARLAAIAASPRHVVFVAEGDSGRLSGLVAVEQRLMLESGERAEIVALVVDTATRRSGAGRCLVDAARQWARLQGNAVLIVRSNIARAESHPFYEGVGFTRTKSQHVYQIALP